VQANVYDTPSPMTFEARVNKGATVPRIFDFDPGFRLTLIDQICDENNGG
jgi:hypothetical protein